MNYYGKYIGNKYSAKMVIRLTKDKTPKYYLLSYSSKMRAIRDFLVYEMGCEVPFTVDYRRNKVHGD